MTTPGDDTAIPEGELNARLAELRTLIQGGELERAGELLAELHAACGEHPELLRLASTLARRRGDAEAALGLIQRAVELAPERDDLRFALGFALQQTGDREGAERAYRAVLANAPDHIDARINLGQALRELDRPCEAEAELRSALAARPEGPGILNNLGLALQDQGRGDEAEAMFRRATEVAPGFAQAWNSLGNLLGDRGRSEEAIEIYHRGLEAAPELVDLHLNLGVAYQASGRLEDAEARFLKVLDLQPDSVEAVANLADVYMSVRNYARAEEVFELALRIAPHDPAIRKQYGYALFERGKIERAFEMFEQAEQVDPSFYDAPLAMANCLERTNDLEGARAVLDRIGEAAQADAQFRILDARLRRRAGEVDGPIAALEALLADDMRESWRRSAHFELGRLYEMRKQADAAWPHFVSGNLLAQEFWDAGRRREGNSFLEEVSGTHQRLADDAWIETFTRLPAPADGLAEPVFLAGFPRSGTTLLDTILDAHRDIQVMEERPMISRVIRRLETMERGDIWTAFAGLDTDTRGELRQLYWDLAKHDEPGLSDQRITVDKLPLLSSRATFVRRVFPGARFILALRHPCDVILSCFMQDFGFNVAMANFYTLDEAVTLYETVMGTWLRANQRMEIPHHAIRYEDVVADLEGQARAVLEFMDLDWDPNVLEYAAHARKRGHINTPSYSQVSQPIYQHARYRWQRYAAYFEPVLERIAPFAEAFGYGDVFEDAARGADS